MSPIFNYEALHVFKTVSGLNETTEVTNRVSCRVHRCFVPSSTSYPDGSISEASCPPDVADLSRHTVFYFENRLGAA